MMRRLYILLLSAAVMAGCATQSASLSYWLSPKKKSPVSTTLIAQGTILQLDFDGGGPEKLCEVGSDYLVICRGADKTYYPLSQVRISE